MRIYTILFLAAALFLINGQAQAHNEPPHTGGSGGPCWIWELAVTPFYCIFVEGTRLDHPYPVWLEEWKADRPSSDV